ncbi:MAG: GNAT family N-acetyltransferase [Akkermansiaceae bacterium]
MIQIREAEDGDAGVISVLLVELGYELSVDGVLDRLTEYGKIGGRIWVAVDDGVVVGFLSFQFTTFFHAVGKSGRITAMCVGNGYRRKGIGRQLLQRMESHAKSEGCERIEVTSGEYRSEEAHRFYEAEGYAPASRRFLKNLN